MNRSRVGEAALCRATMRSIAPPLVRRLILPGRRPRHPPPPVAHPCSWVVVAVLAAYTPGPCQHCVVTSLPPLDDTIVAIASAPGPAAVDVIRLSRPEVYDVAERPFPPFPGRAP